MDDNRSAELSGGRLNFFVIHTRHLTSMHTWLQGRRCINAINMWMNVDLNHEDIYIYTIIYIPCITSNYSICIIIIVICLRQIAKQARVHC